MDTIYKTVGVCSKEIHIVTNNDIITSVSFKSGCDGNLQALSKLTQGMPILEAIEKLNGIKCSGKNTSCPDQLAKALSLIIKQND